MSSENFIKNLPLSSGCSVLKFDEYGIIAIDKKAGRATHPNTKVSSNAKPPMLRAKYNMRNECYFWENPNGEKQHLYLANRLDSPTSGIVITASKQDVADAIKLAFKEKSVKKTYIAICLGRAPKEAKWIDTLSPRLADGKLRTLASKDGLKAITFCKFIRQDSNNARLSLVELNPVTGLTHQLRVQCAKHNLPIVGDATYGNFNFNKKFRFASKINRLFLHCAKTEFTIKLNGKEVSFAVESPLPESFAATMKENINISKVFKF